MSYIPPDGDNILFDFTEIYTHPAPDEIIFDSLIIGAIDPQITLTYTDITKLPIDATWSDSPAINVRPSKPWFRATYHSSVEDVSGAVDEYIATDVEIEIYDITNPLEPILVWGSGYLNFQAYDLADDPILPYHNWTLRSGETCEIIFRKNIFFASGLARDGKTYQWRMRFYCDAEGVNSSWTPFATFSMFNEVWTAVDLLCEGSVNPADVTNITPEFDASFNCNYTEFYIPSILYYRFQVSTDPTFSSNIVWDTGFIEEIPPRFPDFSGSEDYHLDTVTYSGNILKRDGNIYYWRVKLRVNTEWKSDLEIDWFATQNWTFFEEVWFVDNIKTNDLVTPTIKDYYPKYTAQFNDNYSSARATHIHVQVCPYVLPLENARCYRFDSTDEVNIGNASVLRLVGNLTIEFWIRPTATALRTNIVDKCYGGEYAITYETDGRIAYYHGSAGTQTSPYVGWSWQMNMTLNNWYHVAIVRNNTTQEVKCYRASYGGIHTEVPLYNEDGWITPVTSSLSVRIGRGYVGNTYQGDICQVRFWNTVRSINDLDTWAYKETPSSATSLVGYYKLNEISGNSVDSSIYGNTGTVIGTIERRIDGPQLDLGGTPHADWTSVKWDSGWVDIGSLSPGDTTPSINYPSPYESTDDGFYWDGSRFGVRARMALESDGIHYTNWSESYFDMGVATINALFPRVDSVYGTLRVRTLVPAFDAQYDTDAFDPVSYGTTKQREYATHAHIQISTSETEWNSPVWDIGWVELNPHIIDPDPSGIGPYSNMIRMGDPPDPFTVSPLIYDNYYYWRIRFKNEREIEGNWSEVMQFGCVGYVLSEVSNTDIINAFYGGEEYEIYAESKSTFIYYTLINITTGLVLVNSYVVNKGIQPRLIYDGDESSPTYGRITLLFLSNGKFYERNWMINNYTPEVAPSTAPQLIDGALDATCTIFNSVDIEDIAQRPFVPGSPKIYRGSICDETGNLYGHKEYVVEFTIPANHFYFHNQKTYKVYIRNGTYDGSYSDQTEGGIYQIPVGSLGHLPVDDLGCDITSTQKSKLTPWLPDLDDAFIETLPQHAWFVADSFKCVGLDKFGFAESLMGAILEDGDSFKYSTVDTWKYKKSVYPDEDKFGFAESLLGNASRDGDSFKYSTVDTWKYKKSVYPDEDKFGFAESLMGATHETHLPYEWVSGDYYNGQYWSIYNYYSTNIR